MRRSHTCLKCIMLASLCGAACLFKADAMAGQDISEQAYLQDLPVVLSASRLLQPLSDAPNAMTVIDRQMIEASGFRSIADLFRLVPGMYVGNAGANAPIVSLNGVSDQYSRRMQVLVDGRSVYLQPLGGVDWLDLPLLIEDIERIEVVRGPAAASHGTNSFYGVINIITHQADGMNGRAISVHKGETGISDVSAHLGQAGEDFDYRLSIGYRSDDGDNPQRVNDGSTNRIFNLRSVYRPDGDDSVELQLGLNQGSYGQGTLGRYQEAFREVDTSSDYQQLTWIHAWGMDESRLSWYRISRDYLDPYKCVDFLVCETSAPTTFSQGYAQEESNSRRHDLELQNTTQLGASNRAVWGGGIRYDYAHHPLLITVPRSLHQWRVFMHDEWRVNESVMLNVGAMYEDDGAGHANTSPRASLNFHVLPQHTLRASVSSATRNPMLAELYLNTGAEEYWSRAYAPPANGLRPEKIVSRELGYVGRFDDLRVDGRIYHDRVSDIISLDALADLSDLANPKNSFKNLFEATFKGLDISASYPWESGSVTVNYSRQSTSCSFSDYPTQYFNPMVSSILVSGYQVDYLDICSESVPTNSGSMLLSQQLSEALQFSAGYYLRSKVRVIDVSSSFPAESQMRRVDLRMAWKLGKPDSVGGGEIAVVLQNAFQDNYTGYGNVTQRIGLTFKRRAYITATFNL